MQSKQDIIINTVETDPDTGEIIALYWQNQKFVRQVQGTDLATPDPNNK
jgi:hypothetical protein